MDKLWNKLQFVSWGIVGIFLFMVARLYQQTHQNIDQLSFFYQVTFWTILGLNVFIGVWSTRSRASSSTLSFIFLLVSLSSMLIGLNSALPTWMHRITSMIASLFPVVFLHFFIEYVSRKKYKDYQKRFFMFLQFFFFVLREISVQKSNFMASDFFFFGGILLLCLFCISIFLKEKKQKNTLWKPQEIKMLLSASATSILPFILGTLIPGILMWGEFRNIWTLMFILILPVTLGYLLNKKNLIIHLYWKLPLLASFGMYLFIIVLFWSVLRLITDITIMELFLVSHYIIAISYTINILFILYTNYRKKNVHQEMLFYNEEKNSLTYHQLKSSLTEKLFQDYFLLLGKQLMLTSFNIYELNNSEPIFSVGESRPIFSAQEIEKKLNEKSLLLLENKKLFILKISIKDANNYILVLEREPSFKERETEKIQKEIEQIFSSLIDHEELLELKNIVEDRPYTALEKSVYLRELELADLYHDMISRYLHDEVQQNLLSLQYMSHYVSDIETIQKRIKKVVLETESSIKRKTIQWEGLPKTNDSLENLLDKLYKTLRYQYVQVIRKEIMVNSILFAEETSAIQSLLYRCIKELMINIFKHSKAKKFTIKLTNDKNKWYLLVKDDGIGSEYNINETNQFGLVSLYRQITLVNGEMDISTKKNNGFTVKINLPAFVHEEEEQNNESNHRR